MVLYYGASTNPGNFFTDNETAQLGVDVHPAASISPHTSNTSRQRVRPPRFSSGKPCQREQFNLFGAPANSVHSISLIQPPGRVLQYFSPGRMRRHLKVHEHHASQAAASPTRLSRHLSLNASASYLRHGHKSPESADRTYHHRRCRTCAVRTTSGAQRAETESPYALYYLLCCHHRRKKKFTLFCIVE